MTREKGRKVRHLALLDFLSEQKVIGSGISRVCYSNGDRVWKVPSRLIEEENLTENLSEIYTDECSDSVYSQSSEELKIWHEVEGTDKERFFVPILDYFYVENCSEPILVLPKVDTINKFLSWKQTRYLDNHWWETSCMPKEMLRKIGVMLGVDKESIDSFNEAVVEGFGIMDVHIDNLVLNSKHQQKTIQILDWGLPA